MKNKNKTGGNKQKICSFLTLPDFLLLAFFVASEISFAEELPAIIISRVQISGGEGESNNDFIELLNLGDEPIDLKGYRLVKRTKTSTKDATLKSWTSSTVLPPKNYYLWANNKDGFGESILADVSMSGYIADDNGIALRKGVENTGEVVDLLGWGECDKNFFAGHVFNSNPEALQIITRDVNKMPSVEFVLECGVVPRHLGDLWKSDEKFQLCQEQEKTSEIIVPKIVLGKLTMDEHVYENMYAAFEIQKNSNEKVTWNFGDGHKSYLAKTKHKYESVGTYAASVKVYQGKESVVENFLVVVEEYPRPKVQIVEINANPKGSDTENETITIFNKSKRKINLKGWSVATGWKKFVNHPIREDFFIKPGKKKELTRDICAFTLVNDKDKIELRYPDGEVADDVKYKKSKDESVTEEEKYVKGKKGWKWVEGENQKSETLVNAKNLGVNNQVEMQNVENSEKQNNQIETQEIQKKKEIEADDIGKQSFFIRSRNVSIVSKNKIELAVAKIETKPRVLGMQNMRKESGQYFFTTPIVQKHYAVAFAERMLINVNSFINDVLNKLF